MSKGEVKKRRDAAEEVCWSLILMMGLGGIEIPVEWREFLAKGGFDTWVDLAVRTGQLRCCVPPKDAEHEADCNYAA